MPGPVGGREAGGPRRGTVRAVHGTNQNHQGDAQCRHITRQNRPAYSPPVHGLGERPRSVQLQRRRGLPGGARRSRADRGPQRRCSWTSGGSMACEWSRTGRRMEHRLARTRRAVLGSAPAPPQNRACRRFWRTRRTRNTICPQRRVRGY